VDGDITSIRFRGSVIKSVRACAIKTRRTNILELTISEQTQDCLRITIVFKVEMTQSRFGGRGKGRGDGRAGRDGRGGAGRNGRGSGYSSKPKTTKVGLCKELEGNVFDYGGHGAADTMRITQEKIQQYVGIKYGEDIANKLKNKVQVVSSHQSTPTPSRRGMSSTRRWLGRSRLSCLRRYRPN